MLAQTIQNNPEKEANLTEIHLSHTSQETAAYILPMLAHLSQQDSSQWFTWIAPSKQEKQLINRYNFQKENVRLIHTNNDAETLWVLWEAIKASNSSTVVANLSFLDDRSRKLLETAIKASGTNTLILSYRK